MGDQGIHSQGFFRNTSIEEQYFLQQEFTPGNEELYRRGSLGLPVQTGK
jgi:hypothetical protein